MNVNLTYTDLICTWCISDFHVWEKKKSVKLQKRKLRCLNAKADLMICVDCARTHLLVSCLLTSHCGDKEVYDRAHVMFYTLTSPIPYTVFLETSPDTVHLIVFMHVASKISKMSFWKLPSSTTEASFFFFFSRLN